MKRPFLFLVIVLLLPGLMHIADDGTVSAQPQPAARTLTVLVGGGQDTAALALVSGTNFDGTDWSVSAIAICADAAD